jgi:hypothetical protein
MVVSNQRPCEVVGVRHAGVSGLLKLPLPGVLRQQGLRPISAFCFRLSALEGKMVDKIATGKAPYVC